jgi:cysteine desulfurase family protein
MMPIYLDNAATSWPKSPVVIEAMKLCLEQGLGNPGRGGHSFSLNAAREVYESRELLARLVNAPAADKVIFTKNATEAANFVLFGLLNPGDHVVTTSIEHNAVMRPLRQLEKTGVAITTLPCDSCGRLDPGNLKTAIRANTRLIVVNHASNVAGTLTPVHQIGRIAAEAGIPFAVDASQTAGAEPIDVVSSHIDYLIFTGHKSLGGPQGVGGLVLSADADLFPLLFGGTGSASESEIQPDFYPDKLESGTLNGLGIAALGASLREIEAIGISSIRKHETGLMRLLLDGLRSIPHVTLYGPPNESERVGVLALNIGSIPCAEVCLQLEKRHNILTRSGLHCAPAAHRTFGTFPHGSVRFSISRFTTQEEIAAAVSAVSEIASS